MADRERRFGRGELLAVVLILAALAWFGKPTGCHHAGARLHRDLAIMRELIGQYRFDRGYYPSALSDLVDHGYLRAISVDPFTDSSDTWIEIRQQDGTIVDLTSGAPGKDRDGAPFVSY